MINFTPVEMWVSLLRNKWVNLIGLCRMEAFLESNGPWSQLVTNKNIEIKPIQNGAKVQLSSNVTVIPFFVPHRDEYSEAIGFRIEGPDKKVLFIPDIDKWKRWDRSIEDEMKKVDVAFIDGTFFNGEEINNRDISEIPHPFVIESMASFDSLSKAERNKIYFIHFNHTNPLLDSASKEFKSVVKKGYHVARINQVFDL